MAKTATAPTGKITDRMRAKLQTYPQGAHSRLTIVNELMEQDGHKGTRSPYDTAFATVVKELRWTNESRGMWSPPVAKAKRVPKQATRDQAPGMKAFAELIAAAVESAPKGVTVTISIK